MDLPIVNSVDPSVAKKLMPSTISECASYLGDTAGKTCVSINTVEKITIATGIKEQDADSTMKAVKEKLGCDTDRCALTKLSSVLGAGVAENEIALRLKIKGPTDSKLLSNVNIDSVLQQWKLVFRDFYPYNFNMLNYASYAWVNGRIANHPDTLSGLLFIDLCRGAIDGTKYTHAACVINSDTYQGAGKHWMALFADIRNPARWTVEFFNSSGNNPAPEWVSWLVKTKSQMETLADERGLKPEIEIIRACNIRQQKSKSECGLYSLFYIWARLNKIAPEFFMENPVEDKIMFEFRQHLFEDPTRKRLEKFDWDEYSKTVNIKWEKN